MTYREPTAGLLLRIAELEDRVRELEGARKVGGGRLQKLIGAPLDVSLEWTVPRELDAGRHDVLVESLQRRFGTQGNYFATGRSFHWTLLTVAHQRDLCVSMLARNGATVVRVSERFKSLLGMCAAWVILLSQFLVFTVPAFATRSMILPIWALLVLVGLVMIRVAYGCFVRVRERQLCALLQELVRLSS